MTPGNWDLPQGRAAERTEGSLKRAGSVAYKSCAQWPEGCADAIGNYSEDTHATREAADAVCQMLRKHGFGGNCQHYPVRVWIEEVTPLNDKSSHAGAVTHK